MQAGLPGPPPHGGVQPEAGAGVQCQRGGDSSHCALQGSAFLTQTHQGMGSTVAMLL